MEEEIFFKGRTKEELRELLSIYQKALGHNLIVSVSDLHGTILSVNNMFCDASKYKEEELVGKNFRILNSGCHSLSFFVKMWDLLGKGGIWIGEIKNKNKQGNYYWVDTMIVPLKNKKGIVFQYLCLQSLVTEKKRLEEERMNALLETEELLNMTSHKVRGPAATCLGLIQLFEFGPTQPQTQEETMCYLMKIKKAIIELDLFTREFTKHLSQLHEKKKQLCIARNGNNHNG